MHLHELGSRIALIQNLYYTYAHALDAGDSAGFAASFSDDGQFWPNMGPFQPDRGCFSGDSLKLFVRATNAARPRHVMLNVAVQGIDADVACVEALFMLIDTTSGSMSALGRYDDRVTLSSDGWKFQQKKASFLWQSPAYQERMRQLISGEPKPA